MGANEKRKLIVNLFSQIIDETRGKTNFVASVEENEICSPQELTRILIDNGELFDLSLRQGRGRGAPKA